MAAYWPGLNGPFLLDDFGSLGALGDIGGVTDWESARRFVFGGYTGPSGRPLALLTFLIDGTQWPTDPWPFKRTNLLIHLFNGVLVACVSAKIVEAAGYGRRSAQWLGALSGVCWLVHPFLVSTTLYPVQRMAQLAASFVFLGLLVYLQGRARLFANRRSAYLYMSGAIVVCTPLAVLSKENGILLPLLIIVLEATVFSGPQPNTEGPSRAWRALFLWLPSLAVLGFMLKYTAGLNFFEPNPPREFGTYQRLLTESRILFDYLQQWFLPAINTAGVFQDHIAYSRGLFSPVTTVFSLIGHGLLITLCVTQRQRYPLAAFAVLFFYAGHVLESTFLNLELYFEHRNYLPAAFLFVPVFAAIARKANGTFALLASLVIVFGLTTMTFYKARIWSDFSLIVQASARAAPTSARAQQQYSMDLFNSGSVDQAINVVEVAINRMPANPSIRAWHLTMLCQTGRLRQADFATAIPVIANRPYDMRTVRSYELLSRLVVDGNCPNVTTDNLRELFTKMSQHPANAEPDSPMYSQLQYFLGATDVYADRPASALDSFQRSLESRPGASRAMSMAALLATHEHFDEARRISDQALAFKEQEKAGELRLSDVQVEDILEFQRRLPSP